MDLSVVVVSWDTRELTLGCLASVAARRAAAPALAIEAILVDNGSRDGTAAAVRARYPWVRVVSLARNCGFAAGSNRGLAAARGRCVLLLNSDARLLPGALEASLGYLDAHPDVALVGPRLIRPDGRVEGSIHAAPGLLSELVPAPLLRLLLPHRAPPRRARGGAPLDVPALRGAALFARAAAVREVGPLCEDFFFFLEETDWCLRMRRAGHRVVHLPAARVLHLSGASSKRRAPARTRIEYHRSLLRFFARHCGPLRARLVVGLRFAKSLLRALLLAPASLALPRLRARGAEERAVLRWYLAGRPAAGGLAGWVGLPAAALATQPAPLPSAASGTPSDARA